MPVPENLASTSAFCPTSSLCCVGLAEPPARLKPVPICYGPEGWTNCGFGGEEAMVSAHTPQGPRCPAILLCFGKETRQEHSVCWQEMVPGSLWTLACSWLFWPESWRPSWEASLLQSQQQPGPAQPPAQGGGTGWPTEEGPCPFLTYPLTKQPRELQRDSPVDRATQKEATGHDGHKRSSKTAERLREHLRFPHRLFSPRTWPFSQTLLTDKIYHL